MRRVVLMPLFDTPCPSYVNYVGIYKHYPILMPLYLKKIGHQDIFLLYMPN